ncbi:hypothetical protein GIB67_040289 [Kingdonia uniflora]|uniref:Uncharacterized protein n=1 Tax=Kingdonia uniflora TaxID=39325 RepID=A0A7J7MV44_9MAGN|nr:hypothetical protein GIB67_040289 [Kingdonia uniflora]
MKHSLSLALQHYFPLVGKLTWSPQCTAPEIVYVDGDSISFTVVESNFSFHHLCGNHPRNANEFSPLNTPLLPRSSTTGEIIYPLLAMRVTLFPNSGICVGLSISHAVSDAMTAGHFMKLWTLFCNNLEQETTSLFSHLLPSFDRTTIIKPPGIDTTYLNFLENINISQQSFLLPTTPTYFGHDKVVATFIMDLPKIKKLKKWVRSRIIEINKKEPSFNISTLVVTCAYVWVCLIKALGGDNSREHLAIPMDCRAHLDPALPETYFGNCVLCCFATTNKEDLVGEDGIVIAVEVIGKAIHTLGKSVFDDLHNFLDKFFSLASERLFVVGGSPKLGAYDLSFGWGRPKKIDYISATTALGYITLFECGDDGYKGLEIGIAMEKAEMDAFTSFFEDSLNNLPGQNSSSMARLSKI